MLPHTALHALPRTNAVSKPGRQLSGNGFQMRDCGIS
jgi:hypothetical protein